MKTNFTQQEILLLTGTSFSSRQCYQKDDKDYQKPLTEKQQLAEACWNGLLRDMLPEVYEKNEILYLWQIRETNAFIEIELGELPEEMEKYFSIDPYSFLPWHFLS